MEKNRIKILNIVQLIALLLVTMNVGANDFDLVNTDASFEEVISLSATKTPNRAIVNGFQADLDFTDAVTPAVYNVLAGQANPVILDFQVVNIGLAGTALGAGATTLSLPFDGQNFTYNASQSTVPGIWTCSAIASPSASVECITNTVLGSGSVDDFRLAFDLFGFQGSSVAGTYTFSATLFNSAEPTTALVNNIISTNVIVATATDLELNKFAKDTVGGSIITSIPQDTQFVYSIQVNNLSTTTAASGVLVTDNIPLGVEITSSASSNPNWNCTLGAYINVNTSQTVTCSRSTIVANQNPSIEFIYLNAFGRSTGLKTNTATVTLNEPDINIGNNTGSTSISITPPPLSTVSINVTQTPDPVAENAPFNLSITVANTGNSNISSLQVDNTLPAGFSYTGTAPNCTRSGLLMSCSSPSIIAPGASFTILVPVRAINTATINTIYTNTVVASALNITNTTRTTSLNLIQFDTAILKSASASSVAPNSPFNYLLSVSNLGTEDATNVTVIDNLPAGVQLVSFNAPNWSCSGTSQITCTQATLASSATSDIVLNVRAPSTEGLINNSAQVSITEQDNNTGNNISQANVNVITGAVGQPAFADLQLTKTTSSPTLTSGDQYSWQIDILNKGPDLASNIIVNDLLPVGFQFNSVTTTAGSCQNSNTDINCQIPFIFNQDTVTITVSGVADIDSGQLSSIATVTADSTDLVTGNNSDTVTVVVSPIPIAKTDLALTIDSGENINQGRSSNFVINVVNNGPDSANAPALDIAVTGLLETIEINQNSDWNCQINAFVVNCQFNQQQMLNGQLSSIGLTVKTSQVVLDAQDVVVTATVSTTDTDIDSNLSNNTTSSSVAVVGTPREVDIGDALRDALGGSGSPQTERAIQAISSYCETGFFTALDGLCEPLYDAALSGDRSVVDRFLVEITPSEVIGQSTSVAEIASAQFRNVGSRLSQLRGGGSGFSTAGLNARYGNGSIPLGMLSYLDKTDAEANTSNKLADDFVTPWGFFINGSISMGERDSTGRELGFDFDTYGLTAGFDYRLDAKKVIGVALGYANFDSDIKDTAELNSTGITLTGYGSFYVTDNFYVDTRISYGRPKFDQSRDIDFTLGGTSVQRTAVGDTNANQYSVAMSAGYSFYKNAWNITPNASFNYVKTNIDGFTETGAGAFNVIYSDQQWNSLVWSAGLRVSKAISLKKGVITPQFDFNYNYQGKNNAQDITARFINAPAGELFILETDSPDRTYGSAGLGLVYISSGGKQAYINYKSILGLEGFSQRTVNVGARFEF